MMFAEVGLHWAGQLGAHPLTRVRSRAYTAQVRGLLQHNLGLKLISFLISVAIWYKVSFSSAVEIVRTYRVPVRLTNKSPTLVVSHSPESSTVLLTLSGRRWSLLNAQNDLYAVLDLKNVKSPIGEVSLQVEAMLPPQSNLRVLRIEPDVIRTAVKGVTASLPPSPKPSPAPTARF
jgi:YbbR domain-containing protein